MRTFERIGRVGTAIALALLAGAAALVGPGHASAATTRYVSSNPVGTDTSCASPGYNTVNGAVAAAAAGDIVHVCSGSYPESVVITKSISVVGDPGATLTPSGSPVPVASLPPAFTSDNLSDPYANLVVWGNGVKVTVTSLTMTGPFPTPPGNCGSSVFGVLVIANPAGLVTMLKDTVQNTAPVDTNLYGCQFGVGVQIGRKYWPTADFSNYIVEDFAGLASISQSSVTGYDKNGITIDGPGSVGTVSGSTVTGAGPVTYIAQNGIQLSRGAKGKLSSNTVGGNQYTGTGGASSGGLLVFGGCGDELVTGATLSGNTLTNNDVGIYSLNYDPTCSVPVTTATTITMSGNKVSNSADTNVSGFGASQGYQAGILDVGHANKILNNTISGAGYKLQITPSIVAYPIDTTADTDVTLSGNHFTFAAAATPSPRTHPG